MGGAKNCPETPRQRMIGMMYLVLTAMLALNVSAAILNGYQQVDDSLRSTIISTQSGNEQVYAQFHAALEKNAEKTKVWYDKAMVVKAKSDEFFNYIQSFKDGMVQIAEGKKFEPGMPISKMGKKDDTNVPQMYAINMGNADTLVMKINEYNAFLKNMCDDDSYFDEEVDATFQTKVSYDDKGKPIEWKMSLFHEMPMCACVTVLSKMQNDVRNFEGKLLQHLLLSTDAGDLRVNKFDAYVIPKSDYVIKGNKYSAQIILAAVDSTQAPEYYVNGQKIKSNGVYEVIANTVGEQKIKGQIAYMDQQGVMQYLPFERQYTVVEPSATVSHMDLNVIYREYENPFSVSVPGVSSQTLQIKCDHSTVTQANGLWIIKPAQSAPDNLTIDVYANINGTQALMGSHKYRVRDLPRPDAYFEVNGVATDESKIARSALLNKKNKLVASYGKDGLVQAKFQIVSFQVKLPTGASIQVQGDKFDAKALGAIQKLKQGNMITLMYIKAKPTGSDAKEVQLRPLPIELN